MTLSPERTEPARAHAVRRSPSSSAVPTAGVRAGARPSLRAQLWRVAEALATPLVPADYLDLFDPMREGADLRGQIVTIRRETADSATITIKPGRAWRGHHPGQYIRIGIDINGVRNWRAYSLTSVPAGYACHSGVGRGGVGSGVASNGRVGNGVASSGVVGSGVVGDRVANSGVSGTGVTNRGYGASGGSGDTGGTAGTGVKDELISFTVKAIDGGLVSNHLVHQAQVGTTVMLDQATGDFVLPEIAPAKTLFITAGSGITPVMGMLRTRLDLDDVTHVHCAPTADDVIFARELRGYGESGRTTYLERHDDEHGILNLADLDTLVPDWRERATWVCGPTGLLDAAEAHWEAAGLTDNLTVERFRPTIIEPGEGGEITFLASDITVDADGSTPILDAGEDAGILMPSGCRMGICMGCVIPMRQGAVRDLRTGEITVAEPGDNLNIQTCINAVAGTCDLEL